MRRRLAAVTLAALLPAIGMLGYNEFKVRQERHAEVHRQAIRASQQVALEIETVLEGVRGLLVATAAIPAVASAEPQTCRTALRSVSDRLATFVGNILVLDNDGKLLCDALGWERGTDFSDRGYIQQSLSSDQVIVGEYTVARVSNESILPLALRLTRQDQSVGVIATGLHLDWLQRRILERDIPDGGSLTVADRNGVIIARNPDPGRFVGTRIPDKYRPLVTAAVPGSLEVISQDGTARVLGYQPVTDANPLYVSFGISKDVAFAPVNRATVTGILMMLAGGLVAFASANFVGRRFILEPIDHIVNVVTRWREGDRHARTRMLGQHGELGVVGASIDGLLNEIEVRRLASVAAEEKRKLMARELSHRIKNTLTVIQAIVRQTFRGQDAQIATFQQRIAALAGGYDTLLSEDWQPASLRDIVDVVLKPLRPVEADRITLSGPPCLLQPEVALPMSLVLHELGTNALKYGSLSVPGGRLAIAWQVDGESLSLAWTERQGPLVKAPQREGFGSKLIRLAFAAGLDPQISMDFSEDGLEFKVTLRLAPPQARSVASGRPMLEREA